MGGVIIYPDATENLKVPISSSNPTFFAPLRDGVDSNGFASTFTRATIATYKDADGLLKNAISGEQRFQNGAYFCEDNSENLIVESEDFSGWSLVGTPVLNRDAISPDGTANDATRVNDNDGAVTEWIYLDIVGGISATGTYTVPVFIKKRTSAEQTAAGSYPALYMKFQNGASIVSIISIDPYLQKVIATTGGASVTPTIEDYNADYIRVSLARENLNGADVRVGLIPAWSATYGGAQDTTVTGEVTFWGAQLEESKHPSSYIPTAGATVARNDEVLTYATTDFTGEMSWFVEFAMPVGVDMADLIVGNSRLLCGTDSGSGDSLRMFGQSGVAYDSIADGSGKSLLVRMDADDFTAGNTYKISASHKQVGANVLTTLYVNGVAKLTDDSVAVALDWNDTGLCVGYWQAATPGSMNYEVKNVQAWPYPLPAEQLQGLTGS